jgi:hypothetical protein
LRKFNIDELDMDEGNFNPKKEKHIPRIPRKSVIKLIASNDVFLIG